VPIELVEPIAALLPGLVAKGARRVEVFSYARLGEPPYWLAFIFDDGERHVVGTPDLRNVPLTDQVADLVLQLTGWNPAARRGDFK